MELTWSFFPKFYKDLTPTKMATLIRDLGLDTANLIIRNGFPVSFSNIEHDLPLYIEAMKENNITLPFATAGFKAETIIENPDLLSLLSDNGIKAFRMAHFPNSNTPREGLKQARSQMEKVAAICQQREIKAVYQVHHSTLIATPSAAFELVRDLPSEHVGVMLDPGNQMHEGLENWLRTSLLLGDYLAAIGIKDVAIHRDQTLAREVTKGWTYQWCPVDEGIINWYAVFDALKQADFNGTIVFMPFYHENDQERMTACLKREVSYLRGLIKQLT